MQEDLISLYGYRFDSPFNNAPFLDIQTNRGQIDMSGTPIDLLGIDNLGNVKHMKAGRKNPYKFKGDIVREIPMQEGGSAAVDLASQLLSGTRSLHGSGKFPRTYRFEDKRVINPATGNPFKKKGTKTVNVKRENLEKIISHAKAMGIDPATAIAVAYQETGIGAIDKGDLGRAIDADFNIPPSVGDEDIMAYDLVKTLKTKLAYADNLIKRGKLKEGEAYRLQVYNGLGKLFPNTERIRGEQPNTAWYEIPVTDKNPLDLRQNPAFGKTVISLRDSILNQHPYMQPLIDKTKPFKYQDGGRTPIRVTDPNDPRLRSYKDSLSAYNQNNIIKNRWKKDLQEYVQFAIGTDSQELVNKINSNIKNIIITNKNENLDYPKHWNFKRGKQVPAWENSYQGVNPSSIGRFYTNSMPLTGSNSNGSTYASSEYPIYKKPVQPVVHINRRPVNYSDVNNVNYNVEQINKISGNNYQGMDLSQKPTNYSLTYRDENSPSKQRSAYFPDLDAWKAAVNSKYYNRLSSEYTPDMATASGYINYKKGGRNNPYQSGGFSPKQMFDFIFDDESEEAMKDSKVPTAPSVDEVDIQSQLSEIDQQRRMLADEQNDFLAMQMGNPYNREQVRGDNVYSGEILSSGQFGNQNVGDFGKQIYGQLATHLGYAPTVNSIYRSPEQQNQLISAGAPAAKNSWHLSGNAIDLKPTDWHRLSSEQQQFYRSNYDVIVHNNHYHIEPK